MHSRQIAPDLLDGSADALPSLLAPGESLLDGLPDNSG
jgi:hypothetical protein